MVVLPLIPLKTRFNFSKLQNLSLIWCFFIIDMMFDYQFSPIEVYNVNSFVLLFQLKHFGAYDMFFQGPVNNIIQEYSCVWLKRLIFH